MGRQQPRALHDLDLARDEAPGRRSELHPLPDGALWAAGRSYPGGPKTVVARMTLDGDYEPVLTLPSGGDTSYPGMVWHANLLWMSYYASHEGKTSIYLARIEVADSAWPLVPER